MYFQEPLGRRNLQLRACHQFGAPGHPGPSSFYIPAGLGDVDLGQEIGGPSVYHGPGLDQALPHPHRGEQAVTQLAPGRRMGRDEIGEDGGGQQQCQNGHRDQRQLSDAAQGGSRQVHGATFWFFQYHYCHGALQSWGRIKAAGHATLLSAASDGRVISPRSGGSWGPGIRRGCPPAGLPGCIWR